jgi:hypothetical protein
VTSSQTLRQVERVCAGLVRDAQPVSFTTVAARAGISRTTLYRDDTLRAVVEEFRIRSHDPRSLSGLVAEVGHLRTAVEVIAEKVRRHEDQLRSLQRVRKAN